MRNGTLYGKRIRKVFAKLRQEHKVTVPEATDPVEQLVVALLSVDVAPSTARQALKRLSERMVDLNEVRVSSLTEVAEVLNESLPNGAERAQNLQAALNAVFRRRHSLDLSHLHDLPRREARQYLESLEGVDVHSAASVVLWSLGGHAIPVDNRLLHTLKKADLVDPEATVAEVQAFLERHIQAQEAKEFSLLIQKVAPSTASSPPRKKPSSRGTNAETKPARKGSTKGARPPAKASSRR